MAASDEFESPVPDYKKAQVEETLLQLDVNAIAQQEREILAEVQKTENEADKKLAELKARHEKQKANDSASGAPEVDISRTGHPRESRGQNQRK